MNQLSYLNPTILILDVLPKEKIGRLFEFYPHAKTASKPQDATIISCAWTRLKVKNLPSLRYVINRSIGQDHLSIAELQACGVEVLQVPHFCIDEVTNYAMQIINQYNRPQVAVVGIGRIGASVFQECIRQDYNVVRLHHNSPESDIEYALQNCTHITLHMPLTTESYHWLNADRIAYLSSAIVINTARAKEVDTTALLNGINKGYVKHAYLDTVTQRRLIRGNPHISYTNHISWYSPESAIRRTNYTIEKIQEALDALLP